MTQHQKIWCSIWAIIYAVWLVLWWRMDVPTAGDIMLHVVIGITVLYKFFKHWEWDKKDLQEFRERDRIRNDYQHLISECEQWMEGFKESGKRDQYRRMLRIKGYLKERMKREHGLYYYE